VPVKVVAERLGHATTTLTVQPARAPQLVDPGVGRQAADRFAAVLAG
jgi:hypothetical protein